MRSFCCCGVEFLKKGFSLLEVFCVILITTVLFGGIALNLAHSNKSSELTRSGTRVRSMVNGVRMEARSTSSNVALALRQSEEKTLLAMARENESGRWEPVQRWAEIEGQFELVYHTTDHANAWSCMDEGDYSGILIFGSEGALLTNEEGRYVPYVNTDSDQSQGAYLIVKHEGIEMKFEEDLSKAVLMYISPLTGKVVKL